MDSNGSKTKILSPDYLDVPTWRAVVKNNPGAGFNIQFLIFTSEKFLPKILNDAGFFSSNSDVKRNRKDLYREIKISEVVKLKWATIEIIKGDFDDKL